MNRKVEYVVRSLLPPAVLAMRRTWTQARRYQRWPRPLKALRLGRSARLDLLPVSFDLEGGLIVDVGANVGAWSAAVLEMAPNAEIMAIEPIPQAREQLTRRLAGYPNVTIEGRAIGRKPGSATFYVTEADHNASLLKPKAGTNDLYGWGWKVANEIEVEVVDLDTLLAGREVHLLKVDVQGGEKDLILGAEEVLGHTMAVLIEVTMFSHYEGDATLPWIHEHLSNAGFELSALSQPFLSPTQRILWMDACYLRPEVTDSHSLLSHYGPGLAG